MATARFTAEMIDPANVMLTGATGYVGAFLLEALLRDTRADVHCLVRATSAEAGLQRIKRSLEGYLIWDDAYTERIHPVVGDLGQPLLGLSEADFRALAGTLDAVYHNGALVNFAYPYALLKGPNVSGTQEVIRLACQGRPKALHYMGTIDSFVATHVPRPWLEVDPPKEPRRDAPDGYMLSKWVAENLVIGARARGVPVTIYRPTWVISHTSSGASALHNFLLLQLKAYLRMGALPEIPETEPYNGVPIDYLARAVVHLSRQPGSCGKTFHPWSPSQTPFSQIFEWVADFGYRFEMRPRREVVARLGQLDASNSFFPLVPLLERMWGGPEEDHEPTPYEPEKECANALEGLAGSGIECPPTSRELLHSCLSYLIRSGFLPSPN